MEKSELMKELNEALTLTNRLVHEIMDHVKESEPVLAVQGESQVIRDGAIVTLEWSETLPDRMDWNTAVNASKSYVGNWRLPTVTELESIIDRTVSNPSCVIPALSKCYWSASPDANDSNDAWNVSFSNGGENNGNKNNNYHVRLVRDKSTEKE